MYTVEYIAQQLVGRVIGNKDGQIHRVCPPEDIENNSVVFLKDKRNFHLLKVNAESVCAVVDFEPEEKGDIDYIVIPPEMKDAAFIKLLSLFEKKPVPSKTISQRSAISPNARIGENVTISDFVSIGAHTTVGDGSYIGPNTVIGDNCQIGKGCTIYPNVTIYENTIIEDSVILHAGVVVGSDGYSYEKIGGMNHKVPQLGGVRIGKNVEIGANTTVDRATLGYTEIGANTKIDNLVQIAHNCVIGKNTIICGLCGISGSVRIGDNVILAGMVGLADHITIEDDVTIYAKAGVMKKLVKKGAQIVGIPANDLKTEMQVYAIRPKLREMYNDVRKIKQKLDMD